MEFNDNHGNIDIILPNSWDGFDKLEPKILASLDSNQIGLSNESQILFKIWAIIINHPDLKSKLSKIVYSGNISFDDESNPVIRDFIGLMGTGETKNLTAESENQRFRGSGLLNTFDPSRLVENDFELKNQYAGKSPREIFKIRFDATMAKYYKGAEERFPSKKWDVNFLNRVARIYATRNLLDFLT